MAKFSSVRKITHLILIPILLVLSLGNASPTAVQNVYIYANGIQLPAAVQLPIFHVASLAVTAEVTQTLTQNFSSIYDRTLTAQQDKTNGYDRFTLLNQTMDTILEQYGATGGFYAYNPDRAFSNSMDGVSPTPANAQLLACLFLTNHPDLVSSEADLSIPGLSVKCDNNFDQNPLYQVSTEWLAGETAPVAGSPTTTMDPVPLRVMVTVPVMLNAGMYYDGAPLIPLAGPGGHISMIFFNPPVTGAPSAVPYTLDANTPGLQAIAMPAFGRSFSFNRNLPARDPAEAQKQVLGQIMAAYPDAKNIIVPTPALEYYLSDASTPQLALEPNLNFSGVSLETGGQTITLKDITLPAIVPGSAGVGPTVEILSPTPGSYYFPGGKVTLQGKISDGIAPFSYVWEFEDGTPLKSGSGVPEGLLPLFATSLPIPDSKGTPGPVDVRLLVTDADGITRVSVVSLSPPLQAFLPSIRNVTTTASPVTGQAPTGQAAPASPAFVHTFGVEYGSDYPPYGAGGPDLAGVPPDANGLSAGLWSLGYTRLFNWYNANAWEKDWRDCSLGGDDCTDGVDRAEFVYYSGHGSNGGIAVPSNTHDSNWADGINARYSSARWIGFSSCLTLRAQGAAPTPITRWFNAFQGAHLLMGFNSVMADIAFGGPLIDNMRMPTFFGIPLPWAQRTIASAWVQTAFQMNAGKPAYIYAWRTGVDPSTDKLPQVSDPSPARPYPVQWYYWVWWNE